MIAMLRQGLVAVTLAGLGLAIPQSAAAHCDSMDGPVVKAAQQALKTGVVEGVLVWVQPSGEAEIRDAFARTLAARKAGGVAAEVADRWFFETLVRVHRAGEGEPYTGLKPAGYQPEPGIAAADAALGQGTIDAFSGVAAGDVAEALRARFERVRALQQYDPTDVVAGRRYVEAYVAYIHFAEALHQLLHGGTDSHTTR